MTRSQATPESSQIITLTRMLEEREETMYAQASVIEKLRVAIESELNPCGCFAGCEFCNGKMTLEQALAIPTDSTQILDEVRREEREKCAKLCDEYLRDGGKGYAAAIRAME